MAHASITLCNIFFLCLLSAIQAVALSHLFNGYFAAKIHIYFGKEGEGLLKYTKSHQKKMLFYLIHLILPASSCFDEDAGRPSVRIAAQM